MNSSEKEGAFDAIHCFIESKPGAVQPSLA